MNDQVSTNEILEAINTASSETQKQFESLEKRMVQALGKQKHDILDHVDRKFAEFEGSLMASLRQEDNKVNLILEILERHKVAPVDEINRVRSIKLFPAAPEVSS